MNPGFSSTEGILIYTGRFSQVTYDEASETVVIGTGTVWDTVYKQLESYNVTVVGGRVTGVSEHRNSSLARILNPAAM
jgi:FAD/FMN-containing dehydrogenase